MITMSEKFYIGQHVRVKRDPGEGHREGKIGVIVGGDSERPSVEFYDDFPGHDGGLDATGLLRKEDNCWWVDAGDLEPLSKKETALYALGVREGVPFDIKHAYGDSWEYGPYIMENGVVLDSNGDELSEEELLDLFDGGVVPAKVDEEQMILAKIHSLSSEVRELADELNQIRKDLMED